MRGRMEGDPVATLCWQLSGGPYTALPEAFPVDESGIQGEHFTLPGIAEIDDIPKIAAVVGLVAAAVGRCKKPETVTRWFRKKKVCPTLAFYAVDGSLRP